MAVRACNIKTQRPNRANAGFTLVETMLALTILLLLTAVVASGIPVASRTYTKVVDASNAQAALTTTAAKLRSELSLAQDVFFAREGDGSGEREVVFYKTSDGYWAKIVNPDEDKGQKGLYIQAYAGTPSQTGNLSANYGLEPYPDLIPLIPDSAMVGNLKVTCGDITYNYETGVFTVNDLKVTGQIEGESKTLGTVGDGSDSDTDGKLLIRAALY
jgi:prepilin-type N-terminal cleavage/methylation domain-containing protein